MITIFKNKKDIPLNKEYIELNDIFFNQNTATKLDDAAAKYIQMIDGSELLSKYKIRSRFEDIILNTDQLSTGCKTVLNILICVKQNQTNSLMLLKDNIRKTITHQQSNTVTVRLTSTIIVRKLLN